MMARRVAGILPPLTFDEALEATSVHSVAGLLPAGTGLLSHRPFRAPHHTISDIALVGGGQIPRPGEISLAHAASSSWTRWPSSAGAALEVLRQPLEEGAVRIARAARTATFPAQFMLIGAMNPCPCGFAGDPVRVCRCSPQQVARYASPALGSVARSHRPDRPGRGGAGARHSGRPGGRIVGRHPCESGRRARSAARPGTAC